MEDQYKDIIHLEHPVSTRHPHMSLHDRAAQFSPFAALTGHQEAIEETARLTDRESQLDENVVEHLNEQLQQLKENPDSHREVSITYFKPDQKKNGGAYVTCQGIVRKIDEYEKILILEDKNQVKTHISMNRITEIMILQNEDSGE